MHTNDYTPGVTRILRGVGLSDTPVDWKSIYAYARQMFPLTGRSDKERDNSLSPF